MNTAEEVLPITISLPSTVAESDKMSTTSTTTMKLGDQEISDLETCLHTSLTTSLMASITNNLQEIIDKSLNTALEKLTEKMATLVSTDSTILRQQRDMNQLKKENQQLARKVNILEMEHDRLKWKLNNIEQCGLDHCIVIKGIHEMAKEEEKDCVELVYNTIATTIDAENETEHKTVSTKHGNQTGKKNWEIQ